MGLVPLKLEEETSGLTFLSQGKTQEEGGVCQPLVKLQVRASACEFEGAQMSSS